MNTTTAIISKTGFVIIYPTIRNKAIKPMNFAIAPMPDQSPLHAAPIDPIMNNNINANMCIPSTSFLKHTLLIF